jgi:hypothetical protein
MPTTDASRTQMSGNDHCVDTKRPRLPEQSMFPARLAEAVLQIPPFTQVYCSTAAGLGVHGSLKSVSRSGLQVLVPVSLPLRGVVQVTIAHCRAVFGEVLYCIKRSSIYQMGIVFSSRHRPEISVGSLAVVKSLDEPFTLTRGNVLDVGRTRLSIFCKTRLVPGAWVRVEANGWNLFGLVEAVVATSMLACCVDIYLEAAIPAASTDLSQIAQPCEEIANSLQPAILGQSRERDEASRLEGRPEVHDCEDSLACCSGG